MAADTALVRSDHAHRRLVGKDAREGCEGPGRARTGPREADNLHIPPRPGPLRSRSTHAFPVTGACFLAWRSRPGEKQQEKVKGNKSLSEGISECPFINVVTILAVITTTFTTTAFIITLTITTFTTITTGTTTFILTITIINNMRVQYALRSGLYTDLQALLLVAALAGLGLGLSLIFIAVYLIRFCCCRPPEPPGAKSPPPGGGCVTWNCIAALLVGCAGIGVGFYGNSETSDGVSQLSSALLHANHTLTAIDHLVRRPDTGQTLDRHPDCFPTPGQKNPPPHPQEAGSELKAETPGSECQEVLTQRTELVAAARGARRQAETVAQQLQGLAFWRGVPLSPLQVAEDVSFVEEYRWLAYVLLLLLELLVCLFTLLGLARQSKWLVIVMTVMSLLVLVLSWGSMGLEAATAVGLSDFCSSPDSYILNLTQEETGLGSDILNYYFLCNQAVSNPFQQRLTLSQRALANIHSQLQGLEREAVPQFPSAQKPVLSLEETLNVTEGNFHQLVALLHCRGLHKDYGSALRGLCEDTLEGLLFLLLFSLLSAGALATVLCSLPRAWALFPPSDDYEDTDDDDPFNPQESKRFVQWQSSI
nr:PREDICTED: protein tweety homolog 1 [Bos mutus]